MPAAPDFRVYHSNALDVLAALLAAELRSPAPGQSLLAPDIVLIPQVAMRRWLQATLAGSRLLLLGTVPGEGQFVLVVDAETGARRQHLRLVPEPR